jgi:uncharacterized protein
MIKGRKIVLTGASSGIGLELCKILMKENQVFAVSRRIDSIPDSPNIIKFSCDVSSYENIDKLFSEAIKSLGDIDIFFSNAGFAYFEEIKSADWEHNASIYRTNVFSVFYSLQKMKELKETKAFNFVITASAMSFMAIPGYSLYASTKFALKGFTDAYRFELSKNQFISMAYPVATYTDFFDVANAEKMPWPRQRADVVARSIVRGVARNRKHINPSALFVLGQFINRFFPFFSIYQKLEGKKFRYLRKKKLI